MKVLQFPTKAPPKPKERELHLGDIAHRGILEQLLDRGLTLIGFLCEAEGVLSPDSGWPKGSVLLDDEDRKVVILKLSNRFEFPPTLEALGFRACLSFGGVRSEIFVPYAALTIMQGEK